MPNDQQERIKNVQQALNEYFDSQPAPTPGEAKAFLLKLRQDIDIMLVVIDSLPDSVSIGERVRDR